jgi:hypothetical protein
MESTQDQSNAANLGPTTSDYLFLLLIAVILVLVTWLGIVNYKEAIKTEDSKANAEAWVEWLTQEGTQRFEADYKTEACKGGVKPSADAKSDGPVLGTWGACLAHAMANTELKKQINPFFNETPQFIAKCDPADRTVMGGFVLEDLMPTPPGSATPFVASQLVETDAIDYKMQLRLSVCDKGGYAVKVAEFEF